MNVTVTIDTSDRLHNTLNALVAAISMNATSPTTATPAFSNSATAVAPPAPSIQTAPVMTQNQAPATPNTLVPQAAQPAPVMPTQPAPPTPAYTAPQSSAMPATPATIIPTAAPEYTLEMLSNAGVGLIDAGTPMETLQALMRQYGVDSFGQLPKEQYGAVAASLRGLGAKL